ncbi:MAG: propionate catabolism operon regulatory protein PrpR [Deltaproteobacteria bacterium]|nr:propionate catabolism operon regulatory protein PrpR [Deltaproteobacteria bacterium]
MPGTVASTRKPAIWAFSLSRLNELLASVVPQYAAVADIQVFHQGFDDALDTIRHRQAAGEPVDVVVSAGWIGAFLRERAGLPVVVVTPTGFDILQALSRARQIAQRVGIVTYGEVPPELAQFRDLYGLTIEPRAYQSRDDAEQAVRDLKERGVGAVVGPGLVTDLAEAAGLPGVFLYSQSSVNDAFRRALEIARVARGEEAKRERIDAVLAHLSEGVAAVDAGERIQSLNPALERLLGIQAEAVLGERLSVVAPVLSLAGVLASGVPELERIERLGRRTLVTSRIPLFEQGVAIGALVSCQDASAIERVDRSLRSEHRPRRFVARHALSDLLGESPAARQVRELASRYARSDATVLITGESGTGKELCAQGIHRESARRDRPFVAVNCAAFPETLLESELFGYEEGAFTGSRRGGRAGLFEAAHTGTIFLDEVGDLPVPVQTRLLRVLQEREVLRLGSNDPTPVDVRVIAATNRDLPRSVAEGTFRRDLYYRLAILPLRLPSLASRREDIPALAAELLGRALARHGAGGFRERALALLLPRLRAHDWPGNVRELENVVERVAVLCGGLAGGEALSAAHLRAVAPELYGGAEEEPAGARAVGPEEIRRALAACGGNQSAAARKLGIGRTTLWRRLRAG